MCKIKWVYVVQYGTWWRLTAEQWREICKVGLTGVGHNLPENGVLKRRPAMIEATNYGDSLGASSYWCDRDDVLIHTPLDWEPENYKDALEELDRLSAAQPVS